MPQAQTWAGSCPLTREGIVIGPLSSAPLIAVTTSELRPGNRVDSTPQGEPSQTEMALGLKYLRAIESAGGVPVVVPPLEPPALEALLTRVSGLCLSGGPDLDPVAYEAQRHDMLGPTWSELDRFELNLVAAADRLRLPILGICRGLQVLNVSRGGTLHQHLPEVLGEGIVHRQSEPGSQPTHWINLEGPSRLRDILGCRRLRVNSFHHQAVAELGERLVVTGRASDGSVESLEATDRGFLIAVQWHAECLVDRSRQAGLFRAFIEAARRFDQGRTGLLEAA